MLNSLNSFLTLTGKFLVVIGTLLYALGSCEHHADANTQNTNICDFKRNNSCFTYCIEKFNIDMHTNVSQLRQFGYSWLVTGVSHFSDEVSWSFLPCIEYFGLAIYVSCLFIETSTTKRIFLWNRSQWDLHLFCKIGMPFTWTKNVSMSSHLDWQIFIYHRKWVNARVNRWG